MELRSKKLSKELKDLDRINDADLDALDTAELQALGLADSAQHESQAIRRSNDNN